MIKGVIFDLDGVLVHTDELHYQAWLEVSKQHDLKFNRKLNNDLRGISRIDSLNLILKYNNKELSEDEKESICNQKNKHYLSLLDDGYLNIINDDTKSILEYLKSKHYKMAIASSSKNAIKILEITNLLTYFDAIVTGKDVTNSKPHPEIFTKACGLLELDKKECIIIEDAKSGIDAANASGIISVGINDAYFYEKSDYKIETLQSLKELINNINK